MESNRKCPPPDSTKKTMVELMSLIVCFAIGGVVGVSMGLFATTQSASPATTAKLQSGVLVEKTLSVYLVIFCLGAIATTERYGRYLRIFRNSFEVLLINTGGVVVSFSLGLAVVRAGEPMAMLVTSIVVQGSAFAVRAIIGIGVERQRVGGK